jgi:hypothetical protein
MKIVEFSGDPCQRFTVSWSGVQYVIDARYNVRMNDGVGGWTWDLTGPDGTRLLSGIPLVLGMDMLSPHGLGIGGLLAVDTSGQDKEAGPDEADDLGERVKVVWLDEDDLAVISAGGVRL